MFSNPFVWILSGIATLYFMSKSGALAGTMFANWQAYTGPVPAVGSTVVLNGVDSSGNVTPCSIAVTSVTDSNGAAVNSNQPNSFAQRYGQQQSLPSNATPYTLCGTIQNITPWSNVQQGRVACLQFTPSTPASSNYNQNAYSGQGGF